MYEQLSDYINKRITVTAEELQYILSFFKPAKLDKNELAVRQGQVNKRSFFVNKGCLRIYFINEAGQDATRYIAFENNFATALVSFITGSASPEFIQAVEDTELLHISYDNFYHLLEKIPAWEQFYRIYLEKAYVNNTNRLMSFVTMDATARYQQLLTDNPDVIQRLPNKIVASYLNMSQETLSRLKSRKDQT